MGATDSLGTVEAGKIADLVLLDANPLNDIESIRQIRGVVLNGTYLDREALDALLTRAERAAASEKQPVDPGFAHENDQQAAGHHPPGHP
jgi:cytosine/adenosine deaminase-related metal-dependent hydrolase